jgi:hypothetical protein
MKSSYDMHWPSCWIAVEQVGGGGPASAGGALPEEDPEEESPVLASGATGVAPPPSPGDPVEAPPPSLPLLLLKDPAPGPLAVGMGSEACSPQPATHAHARSVAASVVSIDLWNLALMSGLHRTARAFLARFSGGGRCGNGLPHRRSDREWSGNRLPHRRARERGGAPDQNTNVTPPGSATMRLVVRA